MATKLFKALSGDTFKRIIVEDPKPYLADGWTLTPEAPAKEEAKPAAKPKAKRKTTKVEE